VSIELSQLRLDGISWEPNPGMTYDEFAQAGRQLGHLTRACQFMLGDWANHGELLYGERFDQIADATGYSPGTLQGFALTAWRIPPERRVQSLDFTHHQVVAQIEDPELQDKLLARAAQEGLTVEKLKAEVRAFKTALPRPEPQSEALPDPQWSEPPGTIRAIEGLRAAMRALAAVAEAETIGAAWAQGAEVEVLIDGVVR
jgi:hypothetical protein